MSEHAFHGGLIWVWLGLSVVVFLSLLFLVAPYGRHARGGWGPTLETRLAWVLMELPAVAVFAVLWLLTERATSAPAAVLGALWLLHYVHRTFVFPFRMRVGQRRTPWVIVGSGFTFNVGNAYLNGRWLFALSPIYQPEWLGDPRFILGVTCFAAGFAINYHADRVLANLRKPGETGYKIPHGGLYRVISCPNYFGELLEWSGFALAAWSLPALAFAIWTAANLIPRARAHHRWYREKFPDYPASRKALFPGLY